MPDEWADMPVSMAARLGEQVGAAQYACRNRTPWPASSMVFGIATPYPYGCQNRPLS